MRSCPVCADNGFTKFTDLHYALFDDLQLSGEMQLGECSSCKAIYNNTELHEGDFTRYYSLNEYYLDARSAGSGGYSPRDAIRYARIYDQIKGFLPGYMPTVLDFGCGKGGMLSWLKDQGLAVGIGIEASTACRDFLQQRQGLAAFAAISEVVGRVDGIILSHILEHVYAPVRLLAELREIAHSDTVFYIEVPRAEAYLSPEIVWRELYFEHINHFTAEGLQRLLAAGGLRILRQGQGRFYQDVADSPECHSCVTGMGRQQTEETIPSSTGRVKTDTLPAQGIIPAIINHGGPVSIWGISQYTQLVLGTYPGLLAGIMYLFDGSPAKIGRSIAGITIRPAQDLMLLGSRDTLLLPVSPYLEEMEQRLREIGFPGRVVRF